MEKYKTLNTDEIMEYRSVLIRYGYDNKEFSLTEDLPKIKTAPSSSVPRSGIIIKHLTNNKTKTYPCGVGSLWLKDLEQDLKEGYYK